MHIQTSPGTKFQGVHISVSSQRSKSPWLTGSDFFYHSFPDQNHHQHQSSPVSITVWSWDLDWERRPTTTTTRHPSWRRPSPMAITTATRCPWNRLRDRDWGRRPSWAQHRNSNSHNTADGEIDNNDDHRHRDPNIVRRRGEQRPSRSPDNSNKHHRRLLTPRKWRATWPSRGLEIPETFRPTPDQFRAAPTTTSTMDPVQFLFSICGIQQANTFFSRPSRHQNFSTWVRTPVQQQTFLSLIVNNFFTWSDLISWKRDRFK